MLNVLWTALFFGLKNPGLGAFEIVFLWLAIAATISIFLTYQPCRGAHDGSPSRLGNIPYGIDQLYLVDELTSEHTLQWRRQ